MQYISSDTSVWIDFIVINLLELPFRLPYIYCMSSDAIRDELLSPPNFRERLVTFGLLPLDLNDVELQLVIDYGRKYSQLSVYDRIALAIAQNRGFELLSGDGNLRKAAVKEKVMVRGTLWILDQLLSQSLVTDSEYDTAIQRLDSANGMEVRLPPEEIRRRRKMNN